jgi:hypothetical protein
MGATRPLGLAIASDSYPRPVEVAWNLMEVTYLWPPWLSGSYHPRRDPRGEEDPRRQEQPGETDALPTWPISWATILQPFIAVFPPECMGLDVHRLGRPNTVLSHSRRTARHSTPSSARRSSWRAPASRRWTTRRCLTSFCRCLQQNDTKTLRTIIWCTPSTVRKA